MACAQNSCKLTCTESRKLLLNTMKSSWKHPLQRLKVSSVLFIKFSCELFMGYIVIQSYIIHMKHYLLFCDYFQYMFFCTPGYYRIYTKHCSSCLRNGIQTPLFKVYIRLNLNFIIFQCRLVNHFYQISKVWCLVSVDFFLLLFRCIMYNVLRCLMDYLFIKGD